MTKKNEKITLEELKKGTVKTKDLTFSEIFKRVAHREKRAVKEYIAKIIFVDHPDTVLRYVNGDSTIKVQKAEAIAKLLKRPKEQLFPNIFKR